MALVPDTSDGDSTTLTVHSAAAKLAGLLSAEDDAEDTQDDDASSQATADADEAETTEDGEDEADPAPDDESDDAEEDDSADDEPVQPKTRTIKVDGADVTVTDDELVKGYSRQADYTRKTQKLADEAKAFVATQSETRAARQQYLDRITQLDGLLSGVQEPDWATIRKESPHTFADQHAEWQLHKERVAATKAERDETQAQIAKDAKEGFDRYVAAEIAKLPDAIPEWKDAAVSKKEKSLMLDYARNLGYTDDQLGEIADHRIMVILRKAMLFDAASKTRADGVIKATKKLETIRSAPPGPKPSTRPKTTELTRAKQRLAKTGSARDAAAALELMLPD